MPVAMPRSTNSTRCRACWSGVSAEWQDLNGHVNVRHYLELYDAASWPMLATFGLDERIFLEHRRALRPRAPSLVLVGVARGRYVTVHSRMLERNAKRFHGVMFVVDRTRQRLASAFEYVSTGADLDARRTAPLPAAFAAELDRVIAEHARLGWPAPVCGVMSV